MSNVIPAHVPPELVVDFDIFNPPGAETDYFAAWQTLHRADGDYHLHAARSQATRRIDGVRLRAAILRSPTPSMRRPTAACHPYWTLPHTLSRTVFAIDQLVRPRYGSAALLSQRSVRPNSP